MVFIGRGDLAFIAVVLCIVLMDEREEGEERN